MVFPLKSHVLTSLTALVKVFHMAMRDDYFVIDYLQKFQNKVARLVLNYKVTEISRKDLYDEIGWLTVRQRFISKLL